MISVTQVGNSINVVVVVVVVVAVVVSFAVVVVALRITTNVNIIFIKVPLLKTSIVVPSSFLLRLCGRLLDTNVRSCDAWGSGNRVGVSI